MASFRHAGYFVCRHSFHFQYWYLKITENPSSAARELYNAPVSRVSFIPDPAAAADTGRRVRCQVWPRTAPPLAGGAPSPVRPPLPPAARLRGSPGRIGRLTAPATTVQAGAPETGLFDQCNRKAALGEQRAPSFSCAAPGGPLAPCCSRRGGPSNGKEEEEEEEAGMPAEVARLFPT